MKVSEVVGQRLRAVREYLGLSQAELGRRLAAYLGRPWFPQAVSEAEHGRRQFTAEELLALAAVFDKPLSWFFLPLEKDAVYDFPARSVPVGELLDGPLIGRVEANGAQALLAEALDITHTAIDFAKRMHARANAIVDVAEKLSVREEGEE
ncbi:MAG TPA: helix-turn-helix transcriptional regulator [Actinomycetota bacterium]|nr:helix-turn-helix transcriptional regulator [Actinomycetota bacterium]